MDEIEFDPHVTDDVLKLIFTACHPVLSRDGRVALTLKLVGGLCDRAGRAGVSGPDRRRWRHGSPGRRRPRGRAMWASRCRSVRSSTNRFASVLEVVYLIFNEGYAATSGTSWTRAERCDEAMRLGPDAVGAGAT